MQRMKMLSNKFEAVTRVGMSRYFSDQLPIYMVTEYPRSGGTWLAQMLADYLEVPFPPLLSSWKIPFLHFP